MGAWERGSRVGGEQPVPEEVDAGRYVGQGETQTANNCINEYMGVMPVKLKI